MASLPDYDPNDPVDAQKPDRLNRDQRRACYEVGSMFKSFTFAMALDSGAVTIERPRSTRPAPSASAASPSTTSTASTGC